MQNPCATNTIIRLICFIYGVVMHNNDSFKNRDRLIQIGATVSTLRKIRGMSQEQLAEKANISRSFISTIEAPNMVKNFSINILFDLADALEVEASDLLKAANFEDILNKN